MDHGSNLEHNNNYEFITFLRTILMVLENHNFNETVKSFQKECVEHGYHEINSSNDSSDDTKSSPKIIFQNFSKSEPCRIIIENYDKKSNQEDNPTSKIPVLKNKNNKLRKNETNIANNENMQSNEVEMNNNSEDKNVVEIKSKTTTSETKETNYDVLKNKFSSLQNEHQKLMDVVTELTFALQTSIKGQIEDTHIILNNCEKIYPELFCNKPKNVNHEIKTNSEFVNNDLKPIQDAANNYKPCFNLDFQKIKHELKNGDLNTKLLLLQALRWRITKSPALIREYVVKTYIRYDILNVHCCSHQTGLAYPKNSIVFTSFYCSCNSPQSLQQSVARFVNALASVKTGRDYIIHQSVILNILLSVMLGTHPSTPQIDEITRDMIIATLQKISLKYSSRTIMIADGLTEYITKFLITNYLSLNEYSLEYSIALLRNLWLHSESREKCHPIAQDIIRLLANLLDEQYSFCLPYITGSLYNLLPDKYYHRAAKSINLEQIILYRIEKLDGDIKEQLQYILEIFLNPDHWQPLCECDLGTDSENETDVIEPEIDQNDVVDFSTENGEQLLFIYRQTYSIDGGEINTNYINNIFSVPVTPNVNNLSSAKYNNQTNKKIIPEIEYLEYAAQFLNDQMNKKMLSITNGTEFKEVQTEENIVDNEETKKTEIEMTFCEETQQLYVVPSKTRIFATDKTYNLHTYSPSFLKNIGDYDIKNISKSEPVSPRDKNIYSTPSTTATTKLVAQYLSPTANHSGICYREGFKPRSFSDSSTPHIGFCDEGSKNKSYVTSKYSCACFAELQRSFEDDNKKKNNEKVNNMATKIGIRENILSTTYCKYKIYPTSNSAPLYSSPKKERDSSGSKSLDERDYTSVFESRPKILRTP